jgi:hypothetical protein
MYLAKSRESVGRGQFSQLSSHKVGFFSELELELEPESPVNKGHTFGVSAQRQGVREA